MISSVVIVGAGQAGFQTAWALRSKGFDGSITLIGDEPYVPYQRPPLSKEFLFGTMPIEKVDLRPRAFYDQHRIDLRLGQRVVAIDRANLRITLGSGVSIPYSKLVLATGARVRTIPLKGTLYLRGRDDAERLKHALDQARSVAIVGGGFIGLEVAASARKLGKTVTVCEIQPRLLARAVANEIASFLQQLHQRNAVEIVFGSSSPPSADLIVAGIGVMPNDELARDAGLTANNGISVDQYLRTCDENIYAIGDCAEHDNSYAGDRIRLESVQNAVDQATAAAANILGANTPYTAVPWFWTDQFDVKLQMAGLSAAADQTILRGDTAAKKFSVFYFKNGLLIAADSVNRPKDHITTRKLLTAKTPVMPNDLETMFPL